jgi:hypothetical protein
MVYKRLFGMARVLRDVALGSDRERDFESRHWSASVGRFAYRPVVYGANGDDGSVLRGVRDHA